MGRGAVRARERAAAQRRREAAGDKAMFVATDPGKRQMGRSAEKRRQKAKANRKLSGPSEVKKVVVYSNKEGEDTVELTGGFVNLRYHESLLSNTVRVTYTWSDTGDTTNNQKAGTNCKNTTTAVDGLPIVGEEKVELEFTDNRGTTLKPILYVNKVTELDDEATKSLAKMDLVSKEFITNEKGDSRVEVCYQGKISQHIEKILTENLKSEKELDIEETGLKNYNFTGNNKKPFWCMNNLSTKASPKGNKPGNTAGFLLYETSKGYHFKSLDTLLGQKKKKSAIYNESAKGDDSIPAGYDLKIYEYVRDNAVNVQGKHMMGAYSTRLISFDPFSCTYGESICSADTSNGGPASGSPGDQKTLSLAGKNFWQSNKEFDSDMINKSFTRTTWNVLDTGTLMGGTTEEQINKSKEENFDITNVFNQSIQRYNQLFGQTSTITVAGDFSLHVGDAIFIDAPKLEAGKTYENWNKESGGVYIIADLCHYISPGETYTKLNLVRDSMGRKGNHTNLPLKDTSSPGEYDYKPPSNVPYRGGIPLKGV